MSTVKFTQVKSINGANPKQVAELRGLTIAEVLGLDPKGESEETPTEEEPAPTEPVEA